MGYNQINDQINKVVNEALNTMNFSGLNRGINETINSALREAKEGLSQMAGQDQMPPLSKDYKEPPKGEGFNWNQGFYTSDANKDKKGFYNTSQGGPKEDQSKGNAAAKTTDITLAPKRPPGSIKGKALLAGGILGAIGFSIGTIATAVMTFSFGLPLLGAVIGLGAWTGISVGVIVAGSSITNRVKRYHSYRALMGTEDFTEVKAIATSTGLGEKYVANDLKVMTKKAMFPEGHLDDTEQWFIRSHKVYQEYLDAKGRFQERQAQEEEERKKQAGYTEAQKQYHQMMEKGTEYLHQIDVTNDQIQSAEISEQIEGLETVIGKIFDRVREKPELIGETRKFIDYYLPTTLKLITAYRDFEQQPVEAQSMKDAKVEIEATLGTIGEAFQTLLKDLYADTTMDIETDISVLKTMFARDGLTGQDFKDN